MKLFRQNYVALLCAKKIIVNLKHRILSSQYPVLSVIENYPSMIRTRGFPSLNHVKYLWVTYFRLTLRNLI